MWNPPGPGIEPGFPVLAGRFLSTGRRLRQTFFDLWLVESEDAEPEDTESWLCTTPFTRSLQETGMFSDFGIQGRSWNQPVMNWGTSIVYWKSSELRLSLSSLQGSCLKSIKSERKPKGRGIPFTKSRDWFRCPFFPFLSLMVREMGFGTISPGFSVFSRSELILFLPSGFPSYSQSPIQLRFLSTL